jgi:hypothetical protein
MIHVMLPTQYLRRAHARLSEPHQRLMAAVLQTVVDDCRGSAYRRARGLKPILGLQDTRKALAYAASHDRSWPYSFENLCEGLGLDANSLRRELRIPAPAQLTSLGLSTLRP